MTRNRELVLLTADRISSPTVIRCASMPGSAGFDA
jgi:hypothetical protein